MKKLFTRLIPFGLALAISTAHAEGERATTMEIVEERPNYDITHLLEADHAFIMFSVDGCYWCERLEPEYEELHQTSVEADIPITHLIFDHLNLSNYDVDWNNFDGEPYAFPTVVELERGQEINRLIGYSPDVVRELQQKVEEIVDLYGME